MNEQPYLFAPSDLWIPIRDGNVTAISIFKRHYTARTTRKIEQFIGPGEKMALVTVDALALFAWRKFISDAGEVGVNCCVFRNEGTPVARSSELIAAAMVMAWQRWPLERLYTYVDPSKVKHKRDPGRCFIRAGFRKCGVTKSGKIVLESGPHYAWPRS